MAAEIKKETYSIVVESNLVYIYVGILFPL